MNITKRALKSIKGASLVEYGVLITAVGVTAIAAINLLGGKISETYTTAASELNENGSGNSSGGSGSSGPSLGEQYVADNGIPADTMVLTLSTANNLATRLGIMGTGGNITVDWGDGNIDNGTGYWWDHTYASAGDYQVLISGDVTQFKFHQSPGINFSEITNLYSFGNLPLTLLGGAFSYSTQLQYVGSLPSTVTNINAVLQLSTSNPQGFESWNVSNVTRFENAFQGTTTFNRDLSSWNTTNATHANDMFDSAASFNSDLSSWDFPAVTHPLNMQEMFNGASAFSSDLSGWCVSGVASQPADFATGTVSVSQPSWGAAC